MPAAVVGIASVIATVGAAVGSVVVGIASLIGGAVAGIAGVLGGIVGGIASTIGGIAQGLGSIITGISKGLLEPIAGTIKGIATQVSNAVKGISSKLSAAISNLKAAITKPLEPILTPIKDTLQLVKTTVDAIKAPVDAILEPFAAVRQTIQDVANLKILSDILTGQGNISDLLNGVAQGKGESTAAAITQLYKSIATTTVGIMDKIDQEYNLMGATVDSFDERLNSSLSMLADQAKAELMAVVTPKLDTLGKDQQLALQGVARISRHIEDEGWFAAMLIKVLS